MLCRVPTPAALSHPRVKAFFSHCGANGLHESLHIGKPIIGMPFIGKTR